jgi:pilus assembly protein Flp/PilA
MKKMMMKFLRNEKGLTTVEYAVAGALITLAVVTAFTTLGTNVGTAIGAIAGVIGAGP